MDAAVREARGIRFSISRPTTERKKQMTQTTGNGRPRRVRITNDSLNSYGTRVLTRGMDTAQYERNPVLLYMHERGQVIGYVNDLKVEDDEVTGELMFDCATELSRQCRKQWEFGSLKMVSAGLDVLEMSDDESLLVEGQTSPTITKSKLFEVSVVDIGANDDAIVLTRDGRKITLGRDGECPLPLLDNNKQQTTVKMELKTIALLLGLPETADEAAVTAKAKELMAADEKKSELQAKLEKMTDERIVSLVKKAIEEKRLSEENREQFVELGRKVGADDLEKTLNAMSPQVKLSAVLGHQGGAPTQRQPQTFSRLSEVPPRQLAELREKNEAEYRRLYKAEYGFDCELQ